MNDNKERFEKLTQSLEQFGFQDVVSVRPTLCAPYGDDLSVYGFERVDWAPYMWIGHDQLPKTHELFVDHRVFAIGLASVLACLQLDVKPGDKVLDMCAAPGIKSLYLQFLHDKELQMYVNDISHDRLVRLRTLFETFKMPLPTFTHQPGQTLHLKYKEGYFDAVIIDAPCSGEGNIFAGDEDALANWSIAKVKRLEQLQRKLLITGKKLLKEDGQFIYSTCTLNLHENEGALKKAGYSQVDTELTVVKQVKLERNQAVRLRPSTESIGFFVAKL